MSAITLGGDLLHYEKLGRGLPVILLHGWIGSWRYWVPLMQQLYLKYSVYAIDLFGFGDSAKNPQRYTIDQQAAMLKEFMDQLGVPKAAFIGHGLGAMVCAEFARANQDSVPLLLLVNPPLFDPGNLENRVPAGRMVRLAPPAALPSVEEAERQMKQAQSSVPPTTALPGKEASDLLPPTTEATIVSASTAMRAALRKAAESRLGADSGDSLVEAGKKPGGAHLTESSLAANNASPQVSEPTPESPRDGQGFNPLKTRIGDVDPRTLLGRNFRTSDPNYEKFLPDVAKTDAQALSISVQDFDAGRMLDTLRLLKMPLVLVHGNDDQVLRAPEDSVLNYISLDKDATTLLLPLDGVKHFPMLEYNNFSSLVNEFLEKRDVSKIEVKERWRRRTR